MVPARPLDNPRARLPLAVAGSHSALYCHRAHPHALDCHCQPAAALRCADAVSLLPQTPYFSNASLASVLWLQTAHRTTAISTWPRRGRIFALASLRCHDSCASHRIRQHRLGRRSRALVAGRGIVGALIQHCQISRVRQGLKIWDQLLQSQSWADPPKKSDQSVRTSISRIVRAHAGVHLRTRMLDMRLMVCAASACCAYMPRAHKHGCILPAHMCGACHARTRRVHHDT